MHLSRRTVLRYGLGGALVLAAAGAGLALQDTRLRKPQGELRALDVRTYSILAAVADRIIPARDGFPAATALRVPEKIDALLASADPALGQEVKQVLLLIENALAGLVFDARPRPFTQLSGAAQDDVLRAWQTSTVKLRRTAYTALHGLCTASYYADPAIYARVGYPGPPNFGNVAGAGG